MQKDRQFYKGALVGLVFGVTLMLLQPMNAAKDNSDALLKEVQSMQKDIEKIAKNSDKLDGTLKEIKKDISDMANRQSLGTPAGGSRR